MPMGHLGTDVILKAVELKANPSESAQYSSLCTILGVDSVDMIGKQENRFREYKSSFYTVLTLCTMNVHTNISRYSER